MKFTSAIAFGLMTALASAGPVELFERAAGAPTNCASTSWLPAMTSWASSAPSCAVSAVVDVIGTSAAFYDQSCNCWDRAKQKAIACAVKTRCASSTNDANAFQTMIQNMCQNNGASYVVSPVTKGYITKTYTALSQITGC